MTIDKGIFIQNIYYMLSYAFQILKQEDYRQVTGEKFEKIQDLFAAILEKGVSRQVKQGLYALSSGGLFGKGLGNSAQKLGHIPEVHTDMIFSVVVEEMGLIGGAALLILFALLLWRIAVIAINAQELYGTLLCYGVMLHIGLQVCINIAVVTGTMPSTGVTLPFISYGGSSLLVLCAECGVVLNVSRNIGDRKNVPILEYIDPTGANRRNQNTGEHADGGLYPVKNEPTGRKKPKRWPLGLFSGSGQGGSSRKNGKKTSSGSTAEGKKTGSGSRGRGRSIDAWRKARNEGKNTATDRKRQADTVRRPGGTDAPVSETQNTQGRYSIDVELGKPARRDSDE